MISESQLAQGLKLATEVRQKAHAPYSKFQVGAAIKLKNKDQWVGGCNCENSSYGGTVCAERIAVFSSLSQHGSTDFEALVLVTDTPTGDVPCAFCLQVLSEFVGPDFPVICANLDGIKHRFTFKDLLPVTFDKANLP